ncbi:FtsX-like permease family protein [Demequina sp.]|uniref:ABC transporter permease n=1 Tax=Demequina sp. TaxID=2050685 RepID=UPI003D135725
MPRAASPPRLALSRRAASQLPLVASVWVIVATCAGLAAFAAALASAGYQQALSASVAALDASGTDIVTVTVSASEPGTGAPLPAAQATATVVDAVTTASGGYDTEVSVWAAGRIQPIESEARLRGYLLDADTVPDHADLLQGEWPVAASETAIAQSTANALGLHVGDTVTLGDETRLDDKAAEQTTFTVVGVFSPRADDAWRRDPFGGTGMRIVGTAIPEYGPFVVATGSLTSTNESLQRLSVTLDPAIGTDPSGIPGLVRNTARLGDDLTAEFGDSAKWVIVRSELPTQAAAVRSHIQLSTSLAVSVLAVLVALGLAAVSLLAQLIVRRRDPETAALRDRGASTPQLAARSIAEGLLIGATAALVAVPLAWWGYVAVATSGALGEPWDRGATPTAIPGTMWAAAGLGGLAAAALLTLAAIRRPARRGSRGGVVARSGADIALAVVAILGALQLATHTPTAGRVDPVLVIAPAACVLALAALVSRLLPFAARFAERIAQQAKGVAIPLASWHVARGGAARGTFLAVAAGATASLGVVFLATWSQSQTDQADAAVGADVVVANGAIPGGVDALSEIAGGEWVPIAARPVVLGSRPDGVALFAIASSTVSSMVTGRPESSDSWADQVAALGPEPDPLEISFTGQTVTLRISGAPQQEPGFGLPPVAVSLSPTIVAEADSGEIAVFTGGEIELDGEEHTVEATPPHGTAGSAWHVLGYQFSIGQRETGDIFSWVNTRVNVDVRVTIDGATGSPSAVSTVGDTSSAQLTPGTAAISGHTLEVPFSYYLYGINAIDAHLTVLPFADPGPLPVLVTSGLAQDAGFAVGDTIALTSNLVGVEAEVAGIVAYVPGYVHQDALWADREAFSRALLAASTLDAITDAWRGTGIDATGVLALRDAGLGSVTTRAEMATSLREDPAQVPLRLAWVLAIASAVVLAIVGAAAHATSEAHERATTVARLRAIGVARRDALRSHLVQHALVVGAALVIGLALGVALATLIVGSLIVSSEGLRPVPAAELVVPVVPLALLSAGVLALSLAAGVPAARASVSRSTVEALRAGEVG